MRPQKVIFTDVPTCLRGKMTLLVLNGALLKGIALPKGRTYEICSLVPNAG